MLSRIKIEQQPGYILHRHAYRESSLLLEIFTRNHGRLTVNARGCRRKKSGVLGLLLPFNPLFLSWSGRGEIPILTVIEPQKFHRQFNFTTASCGYYCNELIQKLLHRHDSHTKLYEHYHVLMLALLRGDDPFSVLRIFEKYLLQEIGFGLVLDHDAETGEMIEHTTRYRYVLQKGPVATADEHPNTIDGATLIALKNEVFESTQQQLQARQLLRALLSHQLQGKSLRSRRVMQAITQYQNRFAQ